MAPRIFVVGVAIAIACCTVLANGGSFAEADIGRRGSYRVSRSHGNDTASVSISVRPPKSIDAAKSVGNVNVLTRLSISLNGRALVVAGNCQRQLLDINYVRLQRSGAVFQFWIQGGDGAEAYQVAYTFARGQPIKCRFLPDGENTSIEPMLSRKTLSSLPKGIKR